MNARYSKPTKIVIAGGGFAGLYAAKYFERRLARRSDIEVTLISRENFILFTPMLHEVAAGDLTPSDIVNPLRRILRHVKVVQADVQAVDLSARGVRCLAGVRNVELEVEFDHLLLCVGSESNFFDTPGVQDWSVTMKGLGDAALLHNRVLALLEEASLPGSDEERRRHLLTFVVAGGGFSGVETTGAVHDFVRDAIRFYPSLSKDLVRVVVVQAGEFLLPELGEGLGRYAQRKLSERGVEVINDVRVTGYNGSVVRLSDGRSIPATTLVWTAGVKMSQVIESLPLRKERGRLLVDESLRVPGVIGLWSAGDCAAVPTGITGQFHPPTAQHGMREAIIAAKNIEREIAGRPLKPFRFKTIGMLATVGHRAGVAMVFGLRFSGFIAWWMWRTIYLAKLPGLGKKLRVLMGWTLDLLFGREIGQMLTLRDVETLSSRWILLRERRKERSSTSSGSAKERDEREDPTLPPGLRSRTDKTAPLPE